jgi:hypothetical protein
MRAWHCSPATREKMAANSLQSWSFGSATFAYDMSFLQTGTLSLLNSRRATPRIKETGAGRSTLIHNVKRWIFFGPLSFLLVSYCSLHPLKQCCFSNFFTLVLCVYLKGSPGWLTTGRLMGLLWSLSVYLV